MMRHALLVEDDAAFARLMQHCFRRYAPDWQMTCVRTFADTLAFLATSHTDLVVLDLNLPDIRGIATVARLFTAAPTLPIVVLTGIVEDGLDKAVIARGALGFHGKEQFMRAPAGFFALMETCWANHQREQQILHPPAGEPLSHADGSE